MNDQHDADEFEQLLAQAMRARPDFASADDLAERAVNIARRQERLAGQSILALRRKIRRWLMLAHAVAAALAVALVLYGLAQFYEAEPSQLARDLIAQFTALIDDPSAGIDAGALAMTALIVSLAAASGAVLLPVLGAGSTTLAPTPLPQSRVTVL